jgi:hypothetical protein
MSGQTLELHNELREIDHPYSVCFDKPLLMKLRQISISEFQSSLKGDLTDFSILCPGFDGDEEKATAF